MASHAPQIMTVIADTYAQILYARVRQPHIMTQARGLLPEAVVNIIGRIVSPPVLAIIVTSFILLKRI